MHNSPTESQIVVFRIGDDRYALPTQTAREVIAYVKPRRLPGAQPWVEGVINIRGEIVPVCDLAMALALPHSSARGQIVICESGGDSVGLLVDEVLAVTSIDDDQVVASANMSHPSMSGVIELDGTLIVLLSMDNLLSVLSLNDDELEDHEGRAAA